MKLSPLDVEQQQFTRSWRGYQPAEVEKYLSFVAAQLARRDDEVASLTQAMRDHVEELGGLRQREASIKEALLTAQRACDDLREQSAREAKLVVQEAQVQADQMRQSAFSDAANLRANIQQLQQQRGLLREDLRRLLNTHLRVLGDEDTNTYDADDRQEAAGQDVTAQEALEALDAAPPSEKECPDDASAWTSLEDSTI